MTSSRIPPLTCQHGAPAKKVVLGTAIALNGLSAGDLPPLYHSQTCVEATRLNAWSRPWESSGGQFHWVCLILLSTRMCRLFSMICRATCIDLHTRSVERHQPGFLHKALLCDRHCAQDGSSFYRIKFKGMHQL